MGFLERVPNAFKTLLKRIQNAIQTRSKRVQDAYRIFENWFMLSVRISSYGCTREVGRAREKRKSYSRRSREQL